MDSFRFLFLLINFHKKFKERIRIPKEKLVNIPIPKFVFQILNLLKKELKFMVTIRNKMKTHFINPPRRDFFSF